MSTPSEQLYQVQNLNQQPTHRTKWAAYRYQRPKRMKKEGMLSRLFSSPRLGCQQHVKPQPWFPTSPPRAKTFASPWTGLHHSIECFLKSQLLFNHLKAGNRGIQHGHHHVQSSLPIIWIVLGYETWSGDSTYIYNRTKRCRMAIASADLFF